MFSRLILSFADAAGLGLQDHAADAEAVLGELVAVGRDAEEDLPAHQPRLVEGDQAGRVGVVAGAVGGLELDHRHAAPGLLVDDLDGEVAAGVGRLRSRTARTRREERHEEDHGVGDHAAHDSIATAGLRHLHALLHRNPASLVKPPS